MKTEQEYLKNANECPSCSSDDINGGHADFDGDYCVLTVTCGECSLEWKDIYTLTSMKLVE